MNHSLYILKAEGVPTKEAMEEILMEINYCEFCNDGSFLLRLQTFDYDQVEGKGVAILEVAAEPSVDIQDKMWELIQCEFCHSDIEDFSLEPYQKTVQKGDKIQIRKDIGLFDLEGAEGTIAHIYENQQELETAELNHNLYFDVLIDGVGQFLFNYSDVKMLY